MFKYILKRTLYMILTLFIISTLTFFMIRLIPGNPIEAMCENLPGQVRDNMFREYGFDKPVSQQYRLFWEKLITEGDLGESLKYRGRKVTDTIAAHAPISGFIGLQAIIIGLIGGITAGIVAAFNRGGRKDYLVMLMAVIGVSIPSFVVAALLQYFVAFKFNLLPATGLEGYSYTILPSLALALGLTAEYARYMRSSCLDVINQDYVLVAKAKGMSTFRLVKNHILKNAIIPIITLLGPQLALMFGGVFVVERIFAVPGLGFYFVSAASDRDYTMVMGQTIFLAFLYLLSLLFVDVVYSLVDPRIRTMGRKFKGGMYS